MDQRYLYYIIFFLNFMINYGCDAVSPKSTQPKNPSFSKTRPHKPKTIDLNLQPSMRKNSQTLKTFIPKSHSKKFYKAEQVHKKPTEDITFNMSLHQKSLLSNNAITAGTQLRTLLSSRPHSMTNPKEFIEQPPNIGIKKVM